MILAAVRAVMIAVMILFQDNADDEGQAQRTWSDIGKDHHNDTQLPHLVRGTLTLRDRQIERWRECQSRAAEAMPQC